MKKQASILSFAEIVQPVGLEKFLSDYWERQYCFLADSTAGWSQRFSGLFSLDDVDTLLALIEETGRGKAWVVNPSPVESDRADSSKTAPPAKELWDPRANSISYLYKKFASGCSIRIDSVEQLHPQLAASLADWERSLAAKVHVNLYMTPNNSHGFGIHIDTHDAHVLQIHGSKQWYLYETTELLPIEAPSYLSFLHKTNRWKVREDEATLLETPIVSAGDYLYIPRGVPHKAETTDELSLHLTLAFTSYSNADLLKALIDIRSRNNVALRQSIHPQLISGSQSPSFERLEVVDELLADTNSSEQLLQAVEVLREEFLLSRSFVAKGHFENVDKASNLRMEDTLAKRPGLVCRTEGSSASAVLHFSSSSITAPPHLLRCLSYIAMHDRFRAKDLPDEISESSRLVLLRRLIREGLLEVSDSGSDNCSAT